MENQNCKNCYYFNEINHNYLEMLETMFDTFKESCLKLDKFNYNLSELKKKNIELSNENELLKFHIFLLKNNIMSVF